ncbi:MAG TPA: ABC transporter substrate-binding protein [Dehalococcoidia bacterium]|nr:ABC transporter substrate-binding protein [Dehalococcoidia bacterium]
MQPYRSQTGALRRPSRRQFLVGGAGLTGTAAFLLACGGGNNNKAASTTNSSGAKPAASAAGAASTAAGTPAAAAAATQTPKKGGRISQLAAITTQTLNPITNWNEGTILSGVSLYDRLVSTRLNKDSATEYVPEAAASVEQPDPLTVVFKLRPGMKYHNHEPVNGRAVAADDIVETEKYIKDNPASQDKSFQTLSMDSVTAADDQTVSFKLKAPNAYLFSGTQLSYPAGGSIIIPKETLSNLDQGWQVGSGPYQLSNFQMNVNYLYKRFDGYHGASQGLPYIDEREWKIIVDPAAGESAFRSEQVQIWAPPIPQTADTVAKDLGAKIAMENFLSLSMVTLSFNVAKPPWNDARVRQAMYRFTNRQQYLDLIESGKGQIPAGLLSVGLKDYQLDASQTAKYWANDLKQAKQLLDAAGYDYNHQVEMSTIDGPRNNQGMQIFQQQAAQVGMKVQITPMQFAEWLNQKILTGNWEAWYSQHPTYDSPHIYLRLQATNTYSVHKYNGLKDPTIDAMIEKSEQTLDHASRVQQVKDIQLALLDKYTPFFLTHNYTAYLARYKYVMDLEINPASTAEPTYNTQMWLNKA